MITIEKARKLRALIEKISAYLSDDEALEGVELFPMWKVGIAYSVGDRVQHASTLYKCVQAHTSQADWSPDKTPALFARVDDPAIEFPEWVQPTGAQDAYMAGDKVSYNGKHWVSTVDNNVWAPGTYGWDEV